MNVKKIHQALVILTALIFALSFLFRREYWIALSAIAMGVCWLLTEKYKIGLLFNLFFVGFCWLAGRGSIDGLPAPLMLFGLCTDLAAWDLSRFLARTSECKVINPDPALVKKHLRKLGGSIVIGYILALIPTFIKLRVNFMVVIVVSLLILFFLGRSMIILRSQKTGE